MTASAGRASRSTEASAVGKLTNQGIPDQVAQFFTSAMDLKVLPL
jgi:hypothetical protein